MFLLCVFVLPKIKCLSDHIVCTLNAHQTHPINRIIQFYSYSFHVDGILYGHSIALQMHLIDKKQIKEKSLILHIYYK